MLCFLIFLCFSKCFHISIYIFSSITLLVLFSWAVFFFFFLASVLLSASNNELLLRSRSSGTVCESVAVWSAPRLTLLLFGCTGVHSCPTEPPDCPLLCLNSLQATATPLCSLVHQNVKMISFYTSLLHEISTHKHVCDCVCVTWTVV